MTFLNAELEGDANGWLYLQHTTENKAGRWPSRKGDWMGNLALNFKKQQQEQQ